MQAIRIGAVNWDCSLPPETYFGYYQTNSLSPHKFRSVTPFYADILGEDKITYHYRTQAEYDRELSYAIDAGIDYFAYVWYGEEGSKKHVQTRPDSCSHKVHELTYARRMHVKSTLRDKIRMCAIVGAHPFTEGDIRELVLTMREPYYEKVDGRPLVYIFNGCRLEIIEPIREMCDRLGIIQPLIIALYNYTVDPEGEYPGAEGLSAYTCEKSDITRYAELSQAVIAENESRRQTGLKIVPLYSVGWDPSPRVERPCPWYGYPNVPYMQSATEEELLAGAKDLTVWIKTKAKDAFFGHILTFAWNEFEEGGVICPVFGKNGEIDFSRTQAFSKVSTYFKEELKRV